MSKTFAIIFDNAVTNVIVAKTKEDAELVTNATCIEYTDENPAGIGWGYDSENGVFIAPLMQEAIEPESVPE